MRLLGNLERIDAVHSVQIRQRISSGLPTIVTGLVSNWSLTQRWSCDALLAKFGDITVGYRVSSSGVHPEIDQNGRSLSETVFGRLADYIALMKSSPNVFLDGNLVCLSSRRGKVNSDLSCLNDDVEIPGFLDPDDVDTVGIWLSGERAKTRLHYDRNGRNNFNAQVIGEKRVVLIPPEQATHLYPISIGSPVHNFTYVNIHAPDLDAFPRFADAEGYQDTLTAGELLFIPAYWYHAFEHLGAINFNVNFWCDATDLRMSSVALRNELATILSQATSQEMNKQGRWSMAPSELDACCLRWSPRRAALDELQSDGALTSSADGSRA
jgi:hypothetical protein